MIEQLWSGLILLWNLFIIWILDSSFETTSEFSAEICDKNAFANHWYSPRDTHWAECCASWFPPGMHCQGKPDQRRTGNPSLWVTLTGRGGVTRLTAWLARKGTPLEHTWHDWMMYFLSSVCLVHLRRGMGITISVNSHGSLWIGSRWQGLWLKLMFVFMVSRYIYCWKQHPSVGLFREILQLGATFFKALKA